MRKGKGHASILLILVFLLVIGIGSIPIGSQVKAQGANLLLNPGFEQVVKEAEPVGWSIYTNNPTKRPGIVTDAILVKEGNKAGYIVADSSLTFSLTGLKAHTNYTYSAYVKLSDAVGTAKVGAKFYDGSQPDIMITATGNSYSLYTVSFTTGNQTTAQVYLWSSSGLSGNQRAFIDQISVVETNLPAATNLVTNASFEQVNNDYDLRPANWRVWPTQGNMPVTISDPANVHEGNRSGAIRPSSSLNYDLTGLTKNTSYKFSAYVKFSDATAGAVLGVKVGNNETKKTVTGTNYTLQEITFNTGNLTTATVYLWDGSLLTSNQRGYIDQARVEEHVGAGPVSATLNVNELLLAKDYEYPLNVTISPSNAPNKNVNFSSNNVAVATVNANGVITAVAAGTAIISATPQAGGSTVSCTVTVTHNKEPWYPGRTTNQWNLTKEDDFNGTQLDSALWTIRGKEYATYHRDDLVSVSDGKLKLKIEREPDGNVVLGRVDTHGEDRQTDEVVKFDQKYGFFEVSAKIPPTEKTYFTFWLFNYPGVFNVDGAAKEGLEIDVTETVWQGDFTETALHWDGYDADHKSTGSGKKAAPNIHNGFHVYGLEWTEDYLKFYYDGKLTWTYTDKANIPLVKEVFILSSGWARSPGWGEGNIDNAQLPYFSEVDWFRTYQRADVGQTPDTIAPILYGVDSLQLPLNSTVDLKEKIYAIDNRDDKKDLANKITLNESNLNRSVKGNYTVTYTVNDVAGNITTKVRNVTVIDPPLNLIQNGHFNAGNLSHWTYDSGKARIAQGMYQGKYAVVDNASQMSQTFTVKPNKVYKVSYDAKLEKWNSGNLFIGVNHGSIPSEQQLTSAEWRPYEFTFTTGSTANAATFYINNTATSKANIDNISIVEM
ncbi:carbohydrate binding domain-containing protein [Paenibacillus sp. CMAA1364]